ncbi:hypothetical protein KGF57_000749 [Candida theae]|uniref:Uncharacterized protein n=1 Tax=Candida theae TaxID=1198502 RepID=A0AAD5BIA9_9ASCO|nr:uncharacterized protein KGF57_000749 [Candida theae]KAI5965483.1 hypothetical protein KGF57_000749 [Candida theae]
MLSSAQANNDAPVVSLSSSAFNTLFQVKFKPNADIDSIVPNYQPGNPIILDCPGRIIIEPTLQSHYEDKENVSDPLTTQTPSRNIQVGTSDIHSSQTPTIYHTALQNYELSNPINTNNNNRSSVNSIFNVFNNDRNKFKTTHGNKLEDKRQATTHFDPPQQEDESAQAYASNKAQFTLNGVFPTVVHHSAPAEERRASCFQPRDSNSKPPSDSKPKQTPKWISKILRKRGKKAKNEVRAEKVVSRFVPIGEIEHEPVVEMVHHESQRVESRFYPINEMVTEPNLKPKKTHKIGKLFEKCVTKARDSKPAKGVRKLLHKKGKNVNANEAVNEQPRSKDEPVVPEDATSSVNSPRWDQIPPELLPKRRQKLLGKLFHRSMKMTENKTETMVEESIVEEPQAPVRESRDTGEWANILFPAVNDETRNYESQRRQSVQYEAETNNYESYGVQDEARSNHEREVVQNVVGPWRNLFVPQFDNESSYISSSYLDEPEDEQNGYVPFADYIAQDEIYWYGEYNRQ